MSVPPRSPAVAANVEVDDHGVVVVGATMNDVAGTTSAPRIFQRSNFMIHTIQDRDVYRYMGSPLSLHGDDSSESNRSGIFASPASSGTTQRNQLLGLTPIQFGGDWWYRQRQRHKGLISIPPSFRQGFERSNNSNSNYKRWGHVEIGVESLEQRMDYGLRICQTWLVIPVGQGTGYDYHVVPCDNSYYLHPVLALIHTARQSQGNHWS